MFPPVFPTTITAVAVSLIPNLLIIADDDVFYKAELPKISPVSEFRLLPWTRCLSGNDAACPPLGCPIVALT